jgi:Zn-finger protein
MKRIANLAVQISCRLHHWTAAILITAWTLPFCSLTDAVRGRFLYACTMARRSRMARNIFAGILRKHRNHGVDCNIWLALAAWRFGRLEMASLLLRNAERLSTGGKDALLANYLGKLAESYLSGQFAQEVRQSLMTVLSELDSGVPVIPIPVSKAYLDMFELWADQVSKHVRASILVIALDESTATYIQKEFGVRVLDCSPFFLVEDSGKLHRYSRSQLWILRTFLVRELIRVDRRVIVLDLDAIPVGSVDAMLSLAPAADIFAQIEPHSIPVDAARKMGFILCCGFMVFYPTEATSRFLDRLADVVVTELDDQVALNHVLVEEGLGEFRQGAEWTEFDSGGVRWACPSAKLVSRNEFEGSVIRHFQQTGQTIDELKTRLGITGESANSLLADS